VNNEAERLETLFGMLRDMHLSRQISEDVYYKGIVSLASDWVVIGEITRAASLVSEVAAQYIEKVMPTQMVSDPEFHKRAFQLARGLATAGGEAISKEDAEIDLLLLMKPVARA